jgi:hypothetical protein
MWDKGTGIMGCPKLKTEGWVFLRSGEKHLLFPRKPREKNRSRSAPAEMDFCLSSEERYCENQNQCRWKSPWERHGFSWHTYKK